MNTDETRIQKTSRLCVTLVLSIHEQTDFFSCRLQLIEQLSFISLVVFGSDVDLYNDTAVNDEISIAVSDNNAFVKSLNAFLGFGGSSTTEELNLQCALIHALEKTVAKLLMYLKGRTDDLLRRAPMQQMNPVQFLCFCVSSVSICGLKNVTAAGSANPRAAASGFLSGTATAAETCHRSRHSAACAGK